MHNFKLSELAIRYDNNLFIPYDAFVDGDCFYSSLVKSVFILCNDLKTNSLRFENYNQISLKYIRISRRILTT